MQKYNFLLIHNRYLVNSVHIRRCTYDTVEMSNNAVLPIAQSKRKEIREKQFELEKFMGVTTLKDFYSMIAENKKLISEIKAKGIVEENEIQKQFDDLLEAHGVIDKDNNILKEEYLC